jgi:hypothetical protein
MVAMIVKFASFLGLVLLMACMFPMNAFAQPTIIVSPTSIVTGQSVAIEGISFGAYDHVGVYADCTSPTSTSGPQCGSLQSTSVTAFNGFFQLQLTFQAVGTYRVYAVDYSTTPGFVTASATVTVSQNTNSLF